MDHDASEHESAAGSKAEGTRSPDEDRALSRRSFAALSPTCSQGTFAATQRARDFAQPMPTAPVQQRPSEPQSSRDPQSEDDTELSIGLFGTELEPVLRQACDGRLSAVQWFRTDWQRGGALTGHATYCPPDGQPREAVVKLPIPPGERYWLDALQPRPDVVPTVFQHDEQLNGYDLAWVVMEALPHGPLGPTWQGAEFDLLTEAAGRFYEATETLVSPEPDGAQRDRAWAALLELAQKQVRSGAVPDGKAWKQALKQAGQKLDGWLERWRQRPIEQWRHGDLHLANAMTRQPPPLGPALMLDLAEVRPGHWVEDAVYFEHLYWAAPERLAGRKLVKQIAHERKRLGLPLDPDWSELAKLKRALLAMATPARLNQDGNPRQLAAALEVLQQYVR